jgi:glyoxylase-like metal-dependent hydrolase (beta-lactamase superfamily II)
VVSPAPRFCADAESWFYVRDVGEGIHLINEPGHVASYLVVGARFALLFDSGLGIAPISEVVRSLTALPVLVVSSHHHIDHRGGNADLAANIEVVDFAAHPAATSADSGCRHIDADREFLTTYAAAMTRVVAEFDRFAALDAQYFFTLARVGHLRPLPDLTAWRILPIPISRTLADGELIDLGGRQLEVLHTPGHAPDALCLFDTATGTLLAGDTVLAAAHWLHGSDADPVRFAASTRRLAALPVTRILAAHNVICELPGTAAAEVADAAEALLAGTTTHGPGRDMLGQPVTRHQCGPVTLLTPPVG